MANKNHFRLITLARLLLFSWNSMAAEDAARSVFEPALPAIPAAVQLELKAAGDAFMREFSASESLLQYRSAFEGLFRRYAPDKEQASTEAGECAATVSTKLAASKDEIGEPIQGEFVYVGCRRTGGRLFKLAYIRKHSLGPVPVVLVFGKGDQKWAISQFGMGEEMAGPDVDALWVHETPDGLKQTIRDFTGLRLATEDCMRGLVQGQTRPSIESLVKRYGRNVANPSVVVDAMVKTVEGRPEVGKSLGYELIGVARQSDSRCKLIYNWRFEKVHAPVAFEFYRNAGGWLLWRVRLFDAAAPDLMGCTVSEPAM